MLETIAANTCKSLFQLVIDPVQHGLKFEPKAAGPAAKMDGSSSALQFKFTFALRTLHRFCLS
jgi:hypothetical protein